MAGGVEDVGRERNRKENQDTPIQDYMAVKRLVRAFPDQEIRQ